MVISDDYRFGELLRGFRNREKTSQQKLANELGVDRNTVGAWERSDYLPKPREKVIRLAKRLNLSADETDHLLVSAHYPPEYKDWAADSSPSKAFYGFLRLADVEGEERVYVLDREELTIGRHPACDLMIPSRYKRASRNHAIITCDHGGVSIEDIGSKRGTFIDGERAVGPTKLQPGQHVLLGGRRAYEDVCVLEFLMEPVSTK